MKKRFIFDENYIKKYANRNKMRWLVIGISGLILIVLIIVVIIASGDSKEKKPSKVPIYELKEELILESGDSVPEKADYFVKMENLDLEKVKIRYPENFEISYDSSLCSEEDNKKIAEGADIEEFSCVKGYINTALSYDITVIVESKEYTVKLVVNDTKPPMLSLKNVEIYAGNKYSVKDFVAICMDTTGTCEAAFYPDDVADNGIRIDYSSFTEPGEYDVKIYAKDGYDNTTEVMVAKLNILKSEETMYTVTFDSNGGSAIDSVKVPEGKTVTEPAVPTREGYIFSGWYMDNVKYDFNLAITKDITLKAFWEKENTETPDPPNPPKPPVVDPINVPVKSISLNWKSINLDIGQSMTVVATINPKNATDKTITWSSDNNSIASVSNGKITGVSPGTTTIRATAGGKSTSMQVTVSSACPFGDANYDTNYILTINLINNNCAVASDSTSKTSDIIGVDNRYLDSTLRGMGFLNREGYMSLGYEVLPIKNLAGTGYVGIQITRIIEVRDPDNGNIMSAKYVIMPNGSRKFISNNIQKNGVSFK